MYKLNIIKEDVNMEFKNLEAVIEKRNQHIFDTETGDDLGGVYEFKYKVSRHEDGTPRMIRIWDYCECFYAGMDEEIGYAADEWACADIGCVEEFKEEFLQAVKKDSGRKDIIIEWADSVTLEIYLGKLE